MTIDVERYLGAVTRTVERFERDGRPAAMVALSRTYDTSVEDLWDAVTNEERLPRWFAPVTGDLRLGGRFQVKGNASGEILVCNAPKHLAVTWEFGGEVSWVDVHMSKTAKGGAHLRLEHVAHIDNEHWEKYGPGAVGIGWDLSVMGLGIYLESRGTAKAIDEEAWAVSKEGKNFSRGSSDDWRRAAIAAKFDKAWAAAAAERTRAACTGETPASG